MKSYGGTQTSNVIVNVWTWPSVRYVYTPAYRVWVSPWGWHARPAWWRPWRPVRYHVYHAYYAPYRPHYVVVHHHRTVHAHRVYVPARRTSVTVRTRYQEPVHRYRSAPRPTRSRSTVQSPHTTESNGQIEHTSGSIGFYNSGQLFLEEYYTLALLTKAGLGTNHVDGNTRLCTSTSSWALKLSFGSDGQPASSADIDHTDTLFLVGHNMAHTQTVLWSRVLDRLAGANPPKLIVVDPRLSSTAEKATVHLMPRVGTNVPLLNALLNLVIRAGAIDRKFLDEHTVGFEQLKTTVAKWTPALVEKITGIPAKKLEQAGQILASTPTLLSTALQGVYQSWQATAAAVQINNLQLIRGLIGKKGSGVLQMNGQPTAQNTRECGANGELPAFFNWQNAEHVK